jgi:hypothetical protein
MSWVKKTDTQEGSRFWSHVQTVAERVRTSEVYANNRVPQESSHGQTDRRCDSQEATSAQESDEA